MIQTRMLVGSCYQLFVILLRYKWVGWHLFELFLFEKKSRQSEYVSHVENPKMQIAASPYQYQRVQFTKTVSVLKQLLKTQTKKKLSLNRNTHSVYSKDDCSMKIDTNTKVRRFKCVLLYE